MLRTTLESFEEQQPLTNEDESLVLVMDGRVDNWEELRRELREAKKFGMDTLDYIIESREEYEEDFRRDYFEWNIHYHLATDEKHGIAKFCELLQKHNLGPVFEPKFVS